MNEQTLRENEHTRLKSEEDLKQYDLHRKIAKTDFLKMQQSLIL